MSPRPANLPTAVFALPLALGTVALLWIVPDLPFRHLDDPSYWGVIGYLASLVPIGRAMLSRHPAAAKGLHRLLVLFLAAMPLVYVANWLRFGNSAGWLAIELVGLAIYGAIAWVAGARRSWALLAAGIAAHALWDALHYGRADYVPDWYVVGCLVIDLGVGIWIAGLAAESKASGRSSG